MLVLELDWQWNWKRNGVLSEDWAVGTDNLTRAEKKEKKVKKGVHQFHPFPWERNLKHFFFVFLFILEFWLWVWVWVLEVTVECT